MCIWKITLSTVRMNLKRHGRDGEMGMLISLAKKMVMLLRGETCRGPQLACIHRDTHITHTYTHRGSEVMQVYHVSLLACPCSPLGCKRGDEVLIVFVYSSEPNTVPDTEQAINKRLLIE